MPSVLVTGASRGIGRAVALRLAERGWDVHAGVRRVQDGDALAADSSRIAPLLLDVTDERQIAALGEALPQDLDAVINNAGIVVDGPVEAIPPGELRRQLEVNVVAPIAVTQAVLPRLRRRRGRVLFVSSVSARTVERALSDRRPRARYQVGAAPKVQARLSATTPTVLNDAAQPDCRDQARLRGCGETVGETRVPERA